MLRNAFENLATEKTIRDVFGTVQDASELSFQISNEVLQSPKARNGDEPIQLVAIHPDFPITLDPGQTVVQGGRQKNGVSLPFVSDQNGAQILSDAPGLIVGQGNNITNNSVLIYCDTQGYQSISLQLFGVWAGTVSFFTSNDSSNWVALAGYSASSGANAITSTTVGGIFSLPTVGRYFKAQITAYTSGTVIAEAWLRNQPMPVLENKTGTLIVNAAQIAGTATVSAGVAGLQAIGGVNAPGVVPTGNPVPIAGWDGIKVRRLLLEESGTLAGHPTGSQTPLNIKQFPSNNAEDGVTDVLNSILRELRFNNFILRQLPYHINQGIAINDEEKDFKEDPTLTKSQ